MSARWHFRQFRPGDNLSDPEFAKALFSGDSGSGLARSLVRESIQNSLDARAAPSRAVTVHYTLRSGQTAIQANAAAAILDGIWPHVNAANNGLANRPTSRELIPFLLVEDFGTRGLTGNPAAWDPFESERNPFFLFFRALGRSGKEGEDRGRWGIGKFVFPLASRGHCLFGLTIPADGPSPALLMGRMVLRTHRAGETSFHPDGHWGTREEAGGLVMPENDPELIGAVRRLFGIRREGEPGLSVIVPWVSAELDGESICTAVVGEYFLPLLRSELEVFIDAEGNVTRVSADTVQKLAESFESDVLRARIALAIEAATWPQHEFTVLPSADDDLEWSDERFPDAVTSVLGDALEAGRPIAVRVPLTLRPKGRPGIRTYFDVFISHQPGIGSTRPLIVREGITIPEDRTASVQDHIALIIVDHAALAGFVGDAETPAHTELQNDLVKPKYTYSKKVLQLIRTSAASILRALSEAAREDDFALLAEFFPVAAPEDRRTSGQRPAPSAKGNAVPDPPEIPRTPPRFRVSRVDGGFSVNGMSGAPLPSAIRVRFAYDVRRGNPLKKFRPYDFSLLRGELDMEVDAAEVVERGDNELVIVPTSNDFRLRVTGFDSNRNVVVRVDTPAVEAAS